MGQKTNQRKTLQKLSTTQKKLTTQNTAKQNYPGFVASYDTQPGNKVGLFYNAPEPTWGTHTNTFITMDSRSNGQEYR